MSSTLPSPPRIITHQLAANGAIPNHPRWPLLVYPAVGAIAAADLATFFEELFDRNGWPAAWRGGIYRFHHFHCDAHEALGVYSGEVKVQFGGDGGIMITARPGDVIVLPAGTGHKKVASRGAVGIVGAYPAGQRPDMCTPALSSPKHSASAIACVSLPERDPVYGADGPLFTHWK